LESKTKERRKVMSFVAIIKRKRTYVVLALLIIALWVSPYFLLGGQTHMRIVDNLDSNVAWYKVLMNSGQLFGSLHANIPQVINGQLSRNAIY
jgi:hypothetical protein